MDGLRTGWEACDAMPGVFLREGRPISEVNHMFFLMYMTKAGVLEFD